MPKRHSVRLAVVALLAATTATSALAADNATLTIQATVAAVCKLGTNSYNMTFALDPTLATDGTATTTVGYRCTKGTAPATFTVGGQANGATGYSSTVATHLVGAATGNTDKLPYKITWTNPTSTGDGLGGTLRTFDLTGTITNADYTIVNADTYSGSIGISITP
jgi:hypothetical protein